MCSSPSSLGIHHGIVRPPADDALTMRRTCGFDALKICLTKTGHCGKAVPSRANSSICAMHTRQKYVWSHGLRVTSMGRSAQMMQVVLSNKSSSSSRRSSSSKSSMRPAVAGTMV
eukprot:3863878-Amphidinium_carterae.2